MFIGGDGGKINTVCWMFIEAQIRGRSRVALKLSDCYIEIFSPWVVFGKKYPPGTSTFSCGLELKHQKWILDDGHWVKSRAK
jgi:hypothetical protein